MSVFAFNSISGLHTYRRAAYIALILSMLWLPGCGGGGSSSNAVTSTNQNPVAVNDSAQVNQDMPININVVANDSDPDGVVQNSSITIVTPPSYGDATANSDGTVTYTPGATYVSPTDSFTYTVTDAQNATSNPATVTISINATPVANDVTVRTHQATPIIINVIANDNDSDGSIQVDTITVESGPTNGNSVANADGTVSYTPNASFIGPSDSFTYSVLDNQGAASNSATVTVTINARPVANNDTALTNKGAPVIINVIANDIDLNGTIQANSISISLAPSNGNIVPNADGTVTYSPDPFFNGPSDSFTYAVSDNEGAISNISTVSIDINLLPQATGMCRTTPQENAFNGTLPANDPDNSPGGLIFKLNSDGSGGDGPIATSKGQVQITDNTTGAFTYTPDAHPAQRGTDSFTYYVEDTEGGFTASSVTIIIDPKIMPLGDSITQGIIDNFLPALVDRGGYREPLYAALQTDGYSFDFVGSRSIGANLLPSFDTDVNGYAGANDEEIAFGGIDGETAVAYAGIYDLLEANPTDIVLLHVGANDLVGALPDTSPNDVRSILLEINRWEDSANGNPVSVVLASTIDQCVNFPTDCGTGEPNVLTYNNNVASMAATLTPATGPDEIIFVDQRTALLDAFNNPDITSYGNNLHPNTNGYNKMSDAWLIELTDPVLGPAIMEKCP